MCPSSLRWGLPSNWRRDDAEMPIPGLGDDHAEQKVLQWLGEVAGGTQGIQYAMEALAFCRRLPQLVDQLSPDAWFALLAHLVEDAGEASVLDAEQELLVPQLLAGELPLTLSWLFPELKPCRALARGARKVLSAGLIDWLDGEGLLHGRHFDRMRPLLACWTRCRLLTHKAPRPCFTAAAQGQYEYMVRHGLRFARHDGSAMLGPAGQEADVELLRAAVAMGGDAEDRKIAAMVLPPATRGAKSRRPKVPALPAPALHSEWAAVALLRPNWSRTSERLAVAYPGPTVQVELGCGKDVLLHGPWSLEVALDGKRLGPESDWEEVCWVSDDDVDYLELEIDLEQGVRVQRQMALAREDRFLFLADAVLGEREGRLEYRATLPLGAGVRFDPAEESREGCLHGAKRRALVLPLAFSEWRSLWAAGELRAVPADEAGLGSPRGAADPTCDAGGKTAEIEDSPTHALELTHAADASRLYAPLFFDLDRRRFARPYTWRRLTVAESLEIQNDDVAVGYRVAMGGSQWLLYRSLAEKANRTLLGHNLSTEALLARFDSTGEIDPLIEVE